MGWDLTGCPEGLGLLFGAEFLSGCSQGTLPVLAF